MQSVCAAVLSTKNKWEKKCYAPKTKKPPIKFAKFHKRETETMVYFYWPNFAEIGTFPDEFTITPPQVRRTETTIYFDWPNFTDIGVVPDKFIITPLQTLAWELERLEHCTEQLNFAPTVHSSST